MYVESICTYDEKVVEFEGICVKDCARGQS